MMCQKGFGRSRVILGYSRDIGQFYVSRYELLIMDESLGMKEQNLKPGGRSVVPPVSVKDRAVVGRADHV